MSQQKSKYVVTIFPAGFSGCAWWRVRNPMENLVKKYKDMEVRILNTQSYNPGDFRKATIDADLIMFQAPGAEIAVDLLQGYKREGKAIVVDYDDYSFDLSPFNPRYKDLGLKEVKKRDENGKEEWVYRDGFGGFDLKSNHHRFNMFKLCCKLSDAVTVTTDYLAKKFLEFNSNTVVVPNSLDTEKWVYHPKPDKYKDEIRLGWFGGDSHYKDLEEIAHIFPPLMEKYKNLKLVLLTPQRWPQLFGKLPQDRVEYHPWADLSIYPLVLSSMHWDIGLVPIEVNEFSKCKSNIKWLEFGALKVPSVATNSIPYSNSIKHGVDGLVADNKDFQSQVEKLIESKSLRESMGQAAYNVVQDSYTLTKNCDNWYNLYKNLIEKNSCERSSVMPLPKSENKVASIPLTLPHTKNV